jgi:hypothetical protein
VEVTTGEWWLVGLSEIGNLMMRIDFSFQIRFEILRRRTHKEMQKCLDEMKKNRKISSAWKKI